MSSFEKRLRILREAKEYSQLQLAKDLSVSNVTLSQYENGVRKPDIETLNKIATYFGVSIDYLLGVSDVRNPYKESETSSEKNSSLTTKDERDIAKKLSSILDEMNNSSDALMFDGERIEMDEESQELLRASIENSLRLAKRLAKEKYTPKKYRE